MIASSAVTTIVRELILPPTSLFGMLAIGIFLKRRHPRTGRALMAAAITILFFLCTGVGARLLIWPLEAMTQALTTTRGTDAGAIVVLGAGRYTRAPEYDGAEIPDYVALARLRYAVRLYRETGLPIMVSGGNGTPDGRLKPVALSMAQALRDEFGVPVRWIEPASENTAENAAFSTRILKRENIGRILLVTDAMHMPRAVMAFAHTGIDVVPAPTIFFSRGQITMSYFLPSAEHLRRSHYAAYEWIGLLWYSLRMAVSSGAKEG
jgi:uncharacterized SAM-binding protein YcdF (DUF218 family)